MVVAAKELTGPSGFPSPCGVKVVGNLDRPVMSATMNEPAVSVPLRGKGSRK